MKYLCDWMEPPVPCELVKGYLEFMPNTWNTIPIKKGAPWVRMVFDACRPHDIREETDTEFCCRSISLLDANILRCLCFEKLRWRFSLLFLAYFLI